MSLSKLWEILKDREGSSVAFHWVSKSWTRLSNLTTTTEVQEQHLHILTFHLCFYQRRDYVFFTQFSSLMISQLKQEVIYALDSCRPLVTIMGERKKLKSLSRVRLFATPWTVPYQALPPMGFSRQEYWSGVSLPSPHHIWGCWYFFRQSCFQLVIHPAWYFASCILHRC